MYLVEATSIDLGAVSMWLIQEFLVQNKTVKRRYFPYETRRSHCWLVFITGIPMPGKVVVILKLIPCCRLWWNSHKNRGNALPAAHTGLRYVRGILRWERRTATHWDWVTMTGNEWNQATVLHVWLWKSPWRQENYPNYMRLFACRTNLTCESFDGVL